MHYTPKFSMSRRNQPFSELGVPQLLNPLLKYPTTTTSHRLAIAVVARGVGSRGARGTINRPPRFVPIIVSTNYSINVTIFLCPEADHDNSKHRLMHQVSCLSSSVLLGNRVRFPRYFQLLATIEKTAIGYYGVIREFRWRRIAFIVQDENLWTVVSMSSC